MRIFERSVSAIFKKKFDFNFTVEVIFTGVT